MIRALVYHDRVNCGRPGCDAALGRLHLNQQTGAYGWIMEKSTNQRRAPADPQKASIRRQLGTPLPATVRCPRCGAVQVVDTA